MRRRLLATAGTLALWAGAASLVAGTSFALLSAVSPSQRDTFASGTVTLTTTASTVCSVGTGTGQTANALFPGSASTGWSGGAGTDAPCTLRVTYTGTISAFLGVDVLVASKAGTLPSGVPAGTTPTPLYDGTANGLQLQLSDATNGAANFYVKGTNFTPQGSTPPPASAIPTVTCPSGFSGFTCYQAADLLVSKTAFVTNGTDTFSFNYQLPTTSTSGYEDSTASIVLTVHAVQASNNASPATCVALAQCMTNFNWS